MQAIELKRGLPVPNLRGALVVFLEKKYHRSASEFEADLGALEGLRAEVINATFLPESLTKMIRYVGQLEQLGKKFPFDGENIKVTFSWYNFTAASASAGGKPIASHDLMYEQASVLMNAALLNAKLGNMEGRGSSDRLRKACNNYLVGAGILQYLIEGYCGKFSSSLPVGSDLTEPVLQALSQLLLAQAQECFVVKGILDKTIRDVMLAKLSISAAVMYETAGELAGREKATIFSPGWIAHCQCKAALLRAQAYYRKSCEMQAGSKYGAEIVRLEQALNAAKEAKSHLEAYVKLKSTPPPPPELTGDVTAITATVTKNLDRARKDNDLIYHDQLPGKEALGEIGTAVVANPIALKLEGEIVGKPLFDSLPDFVLQERILSFYQQRDTIMAKLEGDIKGCLDRLDSAMARMNLPAAVLNKNREDQDNAATLPPIILEKAAQVRGQGGVDSLLSSRATVEMLREDCLAKLNQVDELLGEEETEDDEGRASHGPQQWRRQPSSSLTKGLRERAETFRRTLAVARDSDKLVAKRLEESIEDIRLLQEQLQDHHQQQESTFDKPDILLPGESELKDCLADGEQLVERLKAASVALHETCGSLSTAFLAEPVLSEAQKAEMADEELNRFELDQRCIDGLSSAMDSHLARLESTFNTFSDRSASQTALLARHELVHRLEAAHQAFLGLAGNLQEGLQFYGRCGESVAGLEAEARNYRESRRLEMDDLVRSIEGMRIQQSQYAPGSQQYSPYGAAGGQQQPVHTPYQPEQQSPYGLPGGYARPPAYGQQPIPTAGPAVPGPYSSGQPYQQPQYQQQQPYQPYGQPRPGQWGPSTPVQYAQQQPQQPQMPQQYGGPAPYQAYGQQPQPRTMPGPYGVPQPPPLQQQQQQQQQPGAYSPNPYQQQQQPPQQPPNYRPPY